MDIRLIEFDWGKVSKGLAKTVIKLGVGYVAGAQAADVAGTLLDGFSLAEREKQTADGTIKLWLNRALADAMLEIFAEAQKETATILPTHVEEAPLAAGDLPANFLRDPWTLDVWPVAGEPVLTVLTEAGIERPRALELCGDFADRFALKLRDQWRAMKLDGDGVRAALSTDKLDEACDVAEAWRREREALIGWPKDKENNLIFSKEFPIAEIYVPLRAFEVLEQGGSGFDWDVMERRRDLEQKPKARWSGLMTEIGGWLDDGQADGVLRFVSGGPGSGKSTFARMLAATRAADPEWRVRFLQLHRLRDRDVWDHLTGRGEAVEEAMMAQALAGRRVLLILDGLDELTTLGREGRDRALKLVDRLEGALQDQQDKDRHVRAVILGRDLAVQRAEREAHDAAPTLHVQPLTAYASFVDRFDWQGDPPNDDLLSEWWGNVEVLGYDTPIIPTGSKAGNAIADLKAQPVTNALLAQYLTKFWEPTAEDALESLLEELDRATLYHDILKGIHERDWGVVKGTKLNALTEFDAFLTFLEDVALACFQDDSRTASLAAVETALTDKRVKTALRPALEDSDSLPDQALMAFHVRLATIDGQERLEFTHKSFADYLLARLLLRAAREGEDLGGWAGLFGPFRIEMAVVDFLRPEAERQMVDTSAMERVKDHLSGLLSEAVGPGFPVTAFELDDDTGTGALARRTADAEAALLATLDAVCRSLDREVDGETVIARAKIVWPDEWAAWRMVSRWRAPLSSRPQVSPLLDIIGRLTYSTYSQGINSDFFNESPQNSVENQSLRLEYLYLESADMAGVDLSFVDLTGSYLPSANLEGALFIQSDVSSANFCDANLQKANFQDAILQDVLMMGASLQGANFVGAELDGANIEESDLCRANLSGAYLSGANLLDTDLSDTNLSSANLGRADLRRSRLSRAKLWEANLAGADLRGAQGGDSDDGIRAARNVERAIMTPEQRRALGLDPQPQDRELDEG